MGIKKIIPLPFYLLSICILCVLIITNPKNAEPFYSPLFFNYSPWSARSFFQPYLSTPPVQTPLFGYGYPPWSPPFGFGSQPLLSLLNLAGLPAYFNSPSPGYPYSIGGYYSSTLFSNAGSSYPYASQFPAQTYPYLTPSVAQSPPSYNIYTSPLTSTLAPVPPTLAIISGITTLFGGSGMVGLGGGAVI